MCTPAPAIRGKATQRRYVRARQGRPSQRRIGGLFDGSQIGVTRHGERTATAKARVHNCESRGLWNDFEPLADMKKRRKREGERKKAGDCRRRRPKVPPRVKNQSR
ncbi:hypothetical protein V5799_010206 [Amblyomma americanum]|uniref:Uncharacterized protein n=1 Tax=Amblyomma americanum TaxID=6943 RepID=A0AAQ4F8L8_AMBAM